jgi:hypothetical protein
MYSYSFSPDVPQHGDTLFAPHPGTLPAHVPLPTSKEGRGAVLTLSNLLCSLSVEGAEAIADIVKRAHLKELNLYMNDIGDAGILKVPFYPLAQQISYTDLS